MLGLKVPLLAAILHNLFELAICKNTEYGGSYCKRGELRGIIPNLDRKWDRIDRSVERLEQGINDPTPRIDSVADLLVYCALYLQWMAVEYLDDWQKWWQREVEDLLDKHRSIQGSVEELKKEF